MKWTSSLYILPLVMVGACSYAPIMPTVVPDSNTPIIGLEVRDEDGNPVPQPFGPSGPAEPLLIFHNNVVRVHPGGGSGGGLKTLEIIVGKQVISSGECTAAGNCPYLGAGNAVYRIDLNGIDISDGDPVTIGVTSQGGESKSVYLRARKPVSFTGIISPVLMRASGKASGFKLENFAPSLAGGLQRNFDGDGFRHLGLNAVVTVYTLPDSEYALSLGGLVDAAGYFQVGGTYHTREEEWNLILGIRPEFLFGLIPNLKPKQ